MMKKLLTFLLLITSLITYSQSGVGYLKYTVYNIVSNQVGAYPYDATQFTTMLDTTKGTTVYTRGTTTAAIALNFQNSWSPSGVPNGGNYTAIKTDGFFVPKETGTYSFGIDGDDAVDITVNGVVVVGFYGGHGFGGYRYGTINLTAGQTYTFSTRYQNWGGGWGLRAVWKRPSQGSWSLQTDEITTIASEPTKKARMNFDFGSTLDKTKFSIGSALSSTGWIDVTNQLDSNKVNGNGYKANTTGGQVEWCVIYDYDNTNKRYRVGIDAREFTGTGVTPSTVKKLKLFDLWDGDVTYSSYDPNGWAEYYIYTNTQFNYASSAYSSKLRQGNGFYGVSAEFTFAQLTQYKPQSVTMTTTNTLSTLYNSIVTVTDVYLAFKELQNGGIFGNQSGNEFGYGIQYENADVNDDDQFNETDCYLLLQHLTGKKNLVDTFNLRKTLKLIPKSTYDSIGKSNWVTFPSYLDDVYDFDINTGKSIDTFYISGAWKGDVNLSHSATPQSNGVANMSANFGMQIKSMSTSSEPNAYIISQIFGDSIIATIKFNPNSNLIVGAQFQINYDNSILNFSTVKFKTFGTPTNFANNKETYINVGSLNTGGELLSGITEYQVSFKTKQKLTNSLGLISIGGNEGVLSNGKSVTIKIL